MTKTVNIRCDRCWKDLASTGSMPAYRIVVSQERVEHTTNTVYAIHVQPPLDHDLHFCSIECLLKYFDRDKSERTEKTDG